MVNWSMVNGLYTVEYRWFVRYVAVLILLASTLVWVGYTDDGDVDAAGLCLCLCYVLGEEEGGRKMCW